MSGKVVATISLFVFIIFCFFQVAGAEGRITSGECPLTCKAAGIKKKHCIEWEEGGKCFIEDLRPKKYIEKRACPYSCKMLRLPKHKCQDSRDGDLCVVTRLIDVRK